MKWLSDNEIEALEFNGLGWNVCETRRGVDRGEGVNYSVLCTTGAPYDRKQ